MRATNPSSPTQPGTGRRLLWLVASTAVALLAFESPSFAQLATWTAADGSGGTDPTLGCGKWFVTTPPPGTGALFVTLSGGGGGGGAYHLGGQVEGGDGAEVRTVLNVGSSSGTLAVNVGCGGASGARWEGFHSSGGAGYAPGGDSSAGKTPGGGGGGASGLCIAEGSGPDVSCDTPLVVAAGGGGTGGEENCDGSTSAGAGGPGAGDGLWQEHGAALVTNGSMGAAGNAGQGGEGGGGGEAASAGAGGSGRSGENQGAAGANTPWSSAGGAGAAPSGRTVAGGGGGAGYTGGGAGGGNKCGLGEAAGGGGGAGSSATAKDLTRGTPIVLDGASGGMGSDTNEPTPIVCPAQGGTRTYTSGCPGYVTVTWLPVTTTTLTSSANPSVVGQPLTFTAAVSAPPGAGPPTGTVSFMDQHTVLGTEPVEVVDGKAVASYTAANGLSETTHPITAVYSGDSDLAGSTSLILRQTVNAAATTTSLTSSANPVLVGEPVTFEARVAVLPPGFFDHIGTVTFMDGGKRIGAVSLEPDEDQVRLTTSWLSAGTHPITAVFSGDGNNSGSTSAVLEQVIAPAAVLAPAGHDFGRRLVGTGPSAPFAFTLQNDGKSALKLGAVTLAGPDPTAFSAAADACPATLAAGERCQIAVRFDPSASTVARAVLQVQTDTETATATLAGDATVQPPPVEPPPVSNPSPTVQPPAGPPPAATPQRPKLRLRLHANRSRVRPGQRIRYRLLAGNVGRGAAGRLRLCDRLPAQLTLVAARRQLARSGGRMRNGEVCWTIARARPGAKLVRTLLTRVARNASPGRIVNRASLEGGNGRGPKARAHSVVRVKPRSR